MTVPNIPFRLSDAIQEFGSNGTASDTLIKAGLGATGTLSRLAGMSQFQRLTTVMSTVTTTANPYTYFSWDGTHTRYHHNNDGIATVVNLFKGRAWIKLGPGTVTMQHENCTVNTWFLADATLRGVRKYQKGQAAFELFFAQTNGGQSVYSPISVLNFP